MTRKVFAGFVVKRGNAQAPLLTVGTRIYNHGDMANLPHFGTITTVKADRWGTQYEITPDADQDPETARGPYWIPTCMMSAVYLGNGLSRFVTETEYLRWRNERLAEMRERCAQAVQA